LCVYHRESFLFAFQTLTAFSSHTFDCYVGRIERKTFDRLLLFHLISWIDFVVFFLYSDSKRFAIGNYASENTTAST